MGIDVIVPDLISSIILQYPTVDKTNLTKAIDLDIISRINNYTHQTWETQIKHR